MKKKLLATALVLATAVGLTSCGQISSAATIGKTEISVSTLQKNVDQILADRKKDGNLSTSLDVGAALNRSQLRFLLISYILEQVAAEKKIPVTAADQSKVRSILLGQIGGEAKLPHALVGAELTAAEFPEYIRGYIIQTKIAQVAKQMNIANTNGEATQALVVAYTSKVGVTINPRYGVWDKANANIVDATSTKSPVTTTK